MFGSISKKIMEKTRDYVEDRLEDMAEDRAQQAPRQEPESEGVVRDVIRNVTQGKRSRFLGEYTVRGGDSLSVIAQSQYGNAGQWSAIYEANRDVIGSNPNVIHPGMVLRIPRLDE